MPFTIFRPSLVIGEKDGFTGKLRELVTLGPVVPVPGDGNARFQPIYVEDWVKCFLKIFSDDLPPPPFIKGGIGGIYEFGGPEQLTYNELATQLMEEMGIKKSIIHMPMMLAKAGIPFMGISQKLGGLFGRKIPSVTYEQLTLLGIDNVCDMNSVENLFGFKPITYREALRRFIKKD